jgi:DNA invertase Pin-like site-specific DNA recombinase
MRGRFAPKSARAPRPPGAGHHLSFMRKGDVLMVTRIDRLARSIGDLQDIMPAIKAKGAALETTEQPIDTATAASKCFLDMLGVFARQTFVVSGSWKASPRPRQKACTGVGRLR